MDVFLSTSFDKSLVDELVPSLNKKIKGDAVALPEKRSLAIYEDKHIFFI